LITAAVLVPNLLFLVLPPSDAEKYGTPADSLPFAILERVGQVSSFILPLLFPLSFSGTRMLVAWIVMGVLLAFYYAGWIRYFRVGRGYALLYKPLLCVPVPMALSPVLYFLLSSVVLGSIWQAMGATILGVGHITVTMREYRRVAAKETVQAQQKDDQVAVRQP
jgi:hypothetical protein